MVRPECQTESFIDFKVRSLVILTGHKDSGFLCVAASCNVTVLPTTHPIITPAPNPADVSRLSVVHVSPFESGNNVKTWAADTLLFIVGVYIKSFKFFIVKVSNLC